MKIYDSRFLIQSINMSNIEFEKKNYFRIQRDFIIHIIQQQEA